MVDGFGFEFSRERGIWIPLGETGYEFDEEMGLYLDEVSIHSLRASRQTEKSSRHSRLPAKKITGLDTLSSEPDDYMNEVIRKTIEDFTGDSSPDIGLFARRNAGQSFLNTESKGSNEETSEFESPMQIKKRLDDWVIGQDKAKEALSIAVYEQIRKAQVQSVYHVPSVLMIGDTGCGKTELSRALSNILGVAYQIIKTSELVQPGIVGDTLDSKLKELGNKASGGQAQSSPTTLPGLGVVPPPQMGKGAEGAAQKEQEQGVEAIVHLDEFDKLCYKDGNVYSDALMDQIIGIMDGGQKYGLNLDNVLFIASGAFEELDLYKNADQKQRMGFGTAAHQERRIEKVTDEQLVQYGMKRELAGRFTRRTYLHPLGEEELYQIMTQAQGSVLDETVSFYEKAENVSFSFTEEALRDIASYALEKGTGGRALQGVMEEVLHPYKIHIKEYAGGTIEIGQYDVREAFT